MKGKRARQRYDRQLNTKNDNNMEIEEEDDHGKHHRQQKYLLENTPIRHPFPTFVQGKWILPMDAFPSTKSKWYASTNENFQRTHKYLVCFQDSTDDYVNKDGTVKVDASIFEGVDGNFKSYERKVTKEIFHGREDNGFVRFALRALDKSINDLHNTPVREGEISYACCGHEPRTREDVYKLLFKEDSPGMRMIENEQYGEAVAQVLKYASSVTRQGSNPSRFVERIYDWRDSKGYKFLLGDMAVSGRRMGLHGLVAIARRITCNGYWTSVRNLMATKWKLRMIRGKKGQR